MSVVITPDPSVFARTGPTLVVFGAYRPQWAVSGWDTVLATRLADAVRMARSYRLSVAFCRPRQPSDSDPAGAWLRGCQPRICDMVFDYDPPTCFSNPEMRRALNLRMTRELLFTGPDDDSDVDASIVDASETFVSASRLALSDPMQKSSAPSVPADALTGGAVYPRAGAAMPLSKLISDLRSIRNVE